VISVWVSQLIYRVRQSREHSEEAEKNRDMVRRFTVLICSFAPLHLLAVGSGFSQCTAQSCYKLQSNLILPNAS